MTVPRATGSDIGLDPGHHRFDVGASGGGLAEYQVTMDLAVRARTLLEARGYRVALSRTGSEPVSDWFGASGDDQIAKEQAARIRAVGAVRAYVSIHLNAYGDPSLAGTETYYNSSTAGGAGRALAASLQASVLKRLGGAGYSPRDRGAKEDLADGKPYGHFFSLRGAMPSALVESLFLSNPTEAALLSRDSIRQAIAQGIADGIAAFLK